MADRNALLGPSPEILLGRSATPNALMLPPEPQVEQQNGLWGLARNIFGSAMSGDYLSRGGRRDIEDYAGMMGANLARDLGELARHPENLVGTGNLGIFAGPAARTANHALLRRAQEMLTAGRNRDDIWNETGWFQGRDGRWRFEIDDSGSRLTNEATAAAEYRGPRGAPDQPPNMNFELSRPAYVGPLSSGLHHPELYAAYPEMRGAEFRLDRNGNRLGGYYAPMRPWPGQVSSTGPDDLTRQSISLHEIQHALQEREGFSRTLPDGRRTLQLQRELSDAIRAQVEAGRPRSIWQRMFGPRSPAAPSIAETDEMLARLNRVAADEYHRQAAEAEARNVQTRMLMSPDQRRARPPWTTQDVPDEQQILR